MEEEQLPVIPTASDKTKPGKVSFVDMVQQSLNKGTGADPIFFSEILNEFKKDGTPVELDFDKETKEKIREKQGDEALKEWESMYDSTLQVNKAMGDKDFYEPTLSRTWHNMAQGYTNFRKTGANESDLQGQFAPGYAYPIKIKSDEQVADKAPSIIEFDPLKGYTERKINGPEDIDSITSMFGENKRLIIANNAVMGEVNPEIKQKIKDGILDAEAPFKDENGQYRYRTLKDGERPTSGIRSVWGPETYYHSNYFQELLEAGNDFAMDSLDAAAFIGQLPTNLAANLSQRGARTLGFDANWGDAWNESFHEYRNWSQSRRSTKSFEDGQGAFSNFTNFSKAMVQLVSQIAVTRGVGMLGGAAGTGAKALGLSLSDDAVRGMMSKSAMGYGMMYASSAASEEARRNGLGQVEGDLMAVTAGLVISLSEKMTGGQFTDKVFGPYKSKIYANKIVSEISEQLNKLGIKPSDLTKSKSAYGGFVGNVLNKTHQWLSETAETRAKNTIQGFVGESFQESSEDGLNMLAQEFRDYISGEDKYDNSWKSAFHALGESFALGGIGGSIGGAMFFDKKQWEMNYVEENKYDWITSAVLKGESGQARATLDKMHKEGKLGSTMFSAMQNPGGPLPMSMEKDPVAISQNELLYKQYKSQLDLVETMAKKYEGKFMSKAELGDFITSITGGNEFVTDDDFASIEKNTAHMMQREAVAMEVKRNHAKNRLALELAKANGAVDLSDLENIYAFNGKLVSIQRTGSTPEVPNVQTRNVLENALREVNDNGKEIKDVAEMHEELSVANTALNEAEYKLNKNPLNPEFIAEHQAALAEYEAAQKAFVTAKDKAKLSDDVMDILNSLRTYKEVEGDFSNGERAKFYGHKAILEVAKKKYASDFKTNGDMTVYDFRQRNKDKEYFDESVGVENTVNQDLLVQFDTLVGELAGLDGAALKAKMDEINALSKVSNKLFLSPVSKVLLQQKVADIVANNGLIATQDNVTMRIKAGENLTETRLEEVLRRLMAVTALFDADGKLDPDFQNAQPMIEEAIADEMNAGTDMKDWGEETDWTMMNLNTQGFMAGDSLEVLMQAFETKIGEVQTALEKLAELGVSFLGFDPNEMLDMTNRIMSQEFDDFLATREQKDKMDRLTSAELPAEYLDSMLKDANQVGTKIGHVDFSDFGGEDLNILARTLNANKINQDNAGNSILRKFFELHSDASNDKTKDDFIRLEEVEALRNEIRRNILELVLEHEINDWGKENGNEKFTKLYGFVKLLDKSFDTLIELAKNNLNKRAGRDYRIKQGFVNFEAQSILALNKVLGFLTPEDVTELSGLIVKPAVEATNDEQKKAIDQRLEKLVDFEEKAHEALKAAIAEGHSKQILDKLGLTPDQLFRFNNLGQVSASVFSDLHEDMNDPYDPMAKHSQKELLLNFLVQLERGGIRTFFNRFNEEINIDKAKNTFFPSFEQALSARQLFGFLITRQESQLKGALNAQIPISAHNPSRMDDQMLFVRGIAGAGKSTFVTKLAFSLFAKEMERMGLTSSAIFTAPNDAQLANIAKTMSEVSGQGFSSKEVKADQLLDLTRGFKFEDMGDSRIIVIDEATLLGTNLELYLNQVNAHNLTAAPENKVKVVMIGDEFQNGPDSLSEPGRIVFYTSRVSSVVERTVPLTSPYRSGKIESYNFQLVHRKIISELNKIQRALQYSGDGEIYTKPDETKVKVTDANWRNLTIEVFNHFNTPRSFSYFESVPGVIQYGVKLETKKEELVKGFMKNLIDAFANGSEKDVVMIVQNEEDKKQMIQDALAASASLGGSFTADQLATFIYSSKDIQGLSKKHVFVAIDLEKAILNDEKVEHVRSAMQALYVAESREVDSVVILHPGKHANVKVINRDAVLSYSKVDFGKNNPTDAETREQLELVKENENLVGLIQRLSRPEEAIENPAADTVETTAGKTGQADPEPEKKAGPKNPRPKKEKMQPDKDTKENHEKNMDSDPLAEFLKDPSKIIAKVEAENKSEEEIINDLLNEDDSCTI